MLSALLFAVVAVSATIGPAMAATDREWQDCIADDPAVAIPACTGIIEANGETREDMAGAFHNRALAWHHKGDLDRAITDYDEAIELNPNYSNAFGGRANVYASMGELDRAIADKDKAIDLNPTNTRIFFFRGVLYFRKGDLLSAEIDFNLVSVSEPKDAYAALWDEIAMRRLGLSGKLATARAELDRSVWPAPIVDFYLGEIGLPALLAAAENIGQGPSSGPVCEANFYAGELAIIADNKDDARALLQRAREICPIWYVEYGAAETELATLAD
jgi:tetratricopeptide (TPR) repeat protein